ncbi:MAG: hypothetical protein DMF06_09450 [Verrucomicrobia bacterium]|nr:MAG: hypothetical protein DMF06_09450 [Verrucomicrobiota bacterium]
MPRRFLLLIGLMVALIWGDVASAGVEQMVWSGLVMANNVAQPDKIPPELNRIEGTLKSWFGYNQFKVIGQSRKTLVTGSEDWLASSKYFSLLVDAKGETETGYRLNLKLFQEKSVLLETEARLSKASPLVIKGPQVGDGQLLLVLVIQ